MATRAEKGAKTQMGDSMKNKDDQNLESERKVEICDDENAEWEEGRRPR